MTQMLLALSLALLGTVSATSQMRPDGPPGPPAYPPPAGPPAYTQNQLKGLKKAGGRHVPPPPPPPRTPRGPAVPPPPRPEKRTGTSTRSASPPNAPPAARGRGPVNVPPPPKAEHNTIYRRYKRGGKLWYYNTSNLVWEIRRPNVPCVIPWGQRWVQRKDDNGKICYWDSKNNKTQWEKPEEFVPYKQPVVQEQPAVAIPQTAPDTNKTIKPVREHSPNKENLVYFKKHGKVTRTIAGTIIERKQDGTCIVETPIKKIRHRVNAADLITEDDLLKMSAVKLSDRRYEEFSIEDRIIVAGKSGTVKRKTPLPNGKVRYGIDMDDHTQNEVISGEPGVLKVFGTVRTR